MAEAVGRALAERRHLVVGAGTGTGKSLAYLVPAVLAGRSVVVATATRALQDQLATKDLPLVAEALRTTRTVRFAVLKGRSNYLCRQRAAEVGGAEEAGLSGMALFEDDGGGVPPPAPVRPRHDRHRTAGRPVAPAHRLGRDLSHRRPRRARLRAQRAGLERTLGVGARVPRSVPVSVGHHLLRREGARARRGGRCGRGEHASVRHPCRQRRRRAPEHDIVVLDEAHAVEDVMTEALGVEITAGRLRAVAQATRGLVGTDDGRIVDGVAEVADRLDMVLLPLTGQRVLTGASTTALPKPRNWRRYSNWREGASARSTARCAGPAPRTSGSQQGPAPGRASAAVTTRGRDAVAPCWRSAIWARSCPGSSGSARSRWRGWRARGPRVGPDVAGGADRRRAHAGPTAVAQRDRRAHLGDRASQLERRLGLPATTTDHLEVGSPFPFESCALLYCAKHLPDPRRPGAREALHDELGSLISAAGGGPWRCSRAGAPCTRPPTPCASPSLRGAGPGRPAEGETARRLLFGSCRLSVRHHVVLQGVDVPGPTLSLVTLDRLPFSRPTTRCSKHGATGPGRPRFGASTSPVPPRFWPRVRVGSSAPPPTEGGGRSRLAPRHRQLPSALLAGLPP